MKQLYLIRGIPGSGKTDLAKSLIAGKSDARAFSADDYMMVDGVYTWQPDILFRCHRQCQTAVKLSMYVDIPLIVVHNTLTMPKELRPYLELAVQYKYRVISLIVENRHGNASIHDVPDHTLEAMKARFDIKL